MTITTEKHEIELLLPYYINGTLNEDDADRVKRAIAKSDDLQQELVFLQQLQKQIQQRKENSPGELGLKRLQKALKKQQDTNRQIQSQQTISTSKNRWQLAAMAACLMLVVQTVTNIKDADDVYLAAGGNVVAQHEGEIISITFAPNVSEQEIRNLLLETNVFIVDGPSALGLYRLSVSNNIEQTIKTLETRTDLIESIQQE